MLQTCLMLRCEVHPVHSLPDISILCYPTFRVKSAIWFSLWRDLKKKGIKKKFSELKLNETSSPMQGFPDDISKNLPANTGNTGWIPGSGRSPEEGNGNPFQYYCLENSMDRGTFQLQSRGVTKSQTWLRDWAHISTMQHEASQFRNIQTPYLSNLRWTLAQILHLPCCVWFQMTSENYLWHPTPRNDSIFHLLSCQCFVYQQLSDGYYSECFHSKCYKAKYNQCSGWSRQHGAYKETGNGPFLSASGNCLETASHRLTGLQGPVFANSEGIFP